MRNPFSSNPEEQAEAAAKCAGQLSRAETVGARCCVNILGSRSPSGWDAPNRKNLTKETWNMAVQFIQWLLDMETHERTADTVDAMLWMYPTGPDEYLQLIREVNWPSFAVHLDICNWMNSLDRYLHHELSWKNAFKSLTFIFEAAI